MNHVLTATARLDEEKHTYLLHMWEVRDYSRWGYKIEEGLMLIECQSDGGQLATRYYLVGRPCKQVECVDGFTFSYPYLPF